MDRQFSGEPSLTVTVWWTCVPDDEGRVGAAQIGGGKSMRLERPPSVSEMAWREWCEHLVATMEDMARAAHAWTCAWVDRAMTAALVPVLEDGEVGDWRGEVTDG